MAAAPHVMVIAFPFASHAVKLFRLARALAAAAPAATFSFLSTAALLQEQRKKHDTLVTNLRFVEVPDGLSLSSDSAPLHPMMRLKLFMAAAEAGGLREALETACASADGARVTCVVGDSFMWMAAKAAAEVEAPWVAVWTGGPSALLAHLRADALREDVGDKAPSRADELLTSHPGLGSYRVRDLPNGIVSGDMNSPIVSLFRRIAEHLPRAATAVAFNTFPGLLPDDLTATLAAELPECLPVGPFHLLPFPGNVDDVETSTDPYGCLDWLDRHPTRAIAYVSFGTVVTAVADNPEELRELRELAAGLEASGAPFLWSLPKESWPQLPPGFLDLERGKVVPWAPQAAVLRHSSVGAFVTHAGWASVLEGVSAGVPMACRPFFTDQKMNAQLVARVWGFGTVLEEPMTCEAVAAAVPSLLAGDQGIRMSEKMQEMRGMAASAFAPDGGSRKNLDKLVKIVCQVSSEKNSANSTSLKIRY